MHVETFSIPPIPFTCPAFTGRSVRDRERLIERQRSSSQGSAARRAWCTVVPMADGTRYTPSGKQNDPGCEISRASATLRDIRRVASKQLLSLLVGLTQGMEAL
jgi:hypothetical protein